MHPAIRVEDLGKSYRISHTDERARYRTLRESLVNLVQAPLRRWHANGGPSGSEEFWALKGVDFEIQPGEVVGIIGRNGAGKSTLLKVLSRITKPTTGRIELHGRVGSLLEVGTGFHPELTGRENIFLNGSILGMNRREITRRFDEIVEFAEVDRFLDTPVKRYSSGMHVRLAFSVAAHLEPEILLIDEVLAVGDLSFQTKCLGKMREVSHGGRTVFFVSHNMATIASLCDTGIWLDAGRVIDRGPASEQVTNYIASLQRLTALSVRDRTDRSGTGAVRIVDVSFRDPYGNSVDQIFGGDGITILIKYESYCNQELLNTHLAIYNDLGTPVTYLSSVYSGDKLRGLPGTGLIACEIQQLPLAPGRYLINICLEHENVDLDHIAGAAELRILPGRFFPTGKTPPSSFGYMLCKHKWTSMEVPVCDL